MSKINNLAVYCGSSKGFNPIYAQEAEKLGVYMAQNQIRLIYGAGNVGLMGVVADAVMNNGGQAIGAIPDFLRKWEVAHTGLTEMKVTETMHERKAYMADLCDAVVALPGGYGTLDELFEMLTWAQLNLHAMPVALLNTNGYYNPILAMVNHMVQEGFLKKETQSLLIVANTIEELFERFDAFNVNFVPKWV